MKNRTLIGVVCIILAVAVTFGVSPLVNKISEGKTKVVVLSKDITEGVEITDKDVSIVEIAKAALPEKFITDKNAVVGKYANSTLYKGDVVTENKISDVANTSDNVLNSLSDGKVAMSISVSTFASGLSAKLQNGDIISIYVTDKDKKTTVPPELNYVKVITTTTSGGVDENEVEKNEDGTFDLPSTVTVLVTPKQAVLLANYDETSAMHVALVYRGTEEKAQKYIEMQDKYLKG